MSILRGMAMNLSELSDPGVVKLRRDLLAQGYDDRAIRRMLRDGYWHRIRHGAYIEASVWGELDERGRYASLCRAAYRQSKVPVVLSHAGATNEWDAPLWDLCLDVVDLTRPDEKSGRQAAGVRQHRGRLLPRDTVERHGLAVMSPTRAVLELSTMVDVEHTLVVMDDFLHRKLTDKPLLEARNKLMLHWPDTLHTDLAIRLADGRSESPGETRTRNLCRSQRLPAPVPQYKIRGRAGNVVARVDLAWPELGVFLEFDGKEKYLRFRKKGESVADAVLREKRREEMICEITGWRCIRIVWADLYRPAATAARIRAMFRASAA